MSLGTNIRDHRKKAGLTQKELAAKLGVATGTVQQYELDKRTPRMSMLIKIADIFSIYVDELCANNLTNYINISNALFGREPSNELAENVTPYSSNTSYTMFNELNEKGQKKVVDYLEDIHKISEYRKNT